jgi:hypothetical protein
VPLERQLLLTFQEPFVQNRGGSIKKVKRLALTREHNSNHRHHHRSSTAINSQTPSDDLYTKMVIKKIVY